MPRGKRGAAARQRPRPGVAGGSGRLPNPLLLGSVARAEKVLETSPLGILMSDRTGRIVWANQRAEEMFGYARDELGGLAVELLLPEHLRGAHLAHRASFFDHPRVRPMGLGLDLVARRKDGRTFPVEISLS